MTSWRLATLLVLLAPLVLAAPPSFIGLQLPPHPDDCSVAQAGVLGLQSDQPNRLSYQHLICGSRELVVLTRLIERRDGKAYSVVVDEIEPTIPPGQRLLGTLTCDPTLDDGTEVIAVGTFSRVTATTLVAYDLTDAWRFNLQAEQIEPIPTDDVVCEWQNLD